MNAAAATNHTADYIEMHMSMAKVRQASNYWLHMNGVTMRSATSQQISREDYEAVMRHG